MQPQAVGGPSIPQRIVCPLMVGAASHRADIASTEPALIILSSSGNVSLNPSHHAFPAPPLKVKSNCNFI